MNEKLADLFNRIKADGNLLTVSEAQTSQGIVLPILNNLGWDVFNTSEVTPEYSVSGRRVDFALRIQSINKVFLEIKKTSENLDNHQEQLIYYAFQQGVKLAILTNGVTWQFYLPLEEGNWEQRRFFTIDLIEQPIEDSIEKFESLLSRKTIDSGNSYQKAKSLYEGKQKNKIIKENLPKAWQKLVSEPDEMLVELLNETLERISGFKAENNQITDFLQAVFPTFSIGTLADKQPLKALGSSTKIKAQATNTSQSELKSNRAVASQTALQYHQDAIQLNPDLLDDLLHTKVLEAKLNREETPSNWKKLLETALKIAFEKGLSVKDVQSEVNINFKEGIYTLQGFSPIESVNCSWQNQDANNTAKNIIKLAKLLKAEIYVLFEWREKGKFPMKKGVINWKP